MEYETNRTVRSLAQIKREKHAEKEQEKLDVARNSLIKALTFYQEKYPQSEKGNTWEQVKIKYHLGQKTLQDFLEALSEEDLQNLYEVFDYYSAEIGFHIVKEYEGKKRTIAMIRKLIPGGDYIEKMRELNKDIEQKNKKFEEYKERLTEDRKNFRKRLASHRKIEEPEPEFKCKVCGKVCGNAGGLAVHLKSHEE